MSSTGPGGGAGGSGAGRRLPCGRDEGSLLEAVAEPGTILDAHQQRCPHCSGALRDLRARWSAAVAGAAAVTVPADLVDRVVGRIRTALVEPRYLDVPAARGRLRIAPSVVEDMARQIVGDRGLPVVGCRARQEEHGLTIEVRVVLPYGVAAARAAQQARLAVIRSVAEWAGLDVTAVDVAVVDVELG